MQKLIVRVAQAPPEHRFPAGSDSHAVIRMHGRLEIARGSRSRGYSAIIIPKVNDEDSDLSILFEPFIHERVRSF